MNNLIAYQALHFLDQIKEDPKHQMWTDFYRIFDDPYVGVSDRSGQFKFPIKTKIPPEMLIPDFVKTNITYKECCLERASQILAKQEELDVPIHIMYSGGIDSTAILSAFIDLLGIKEASKRITVIMSKESVEENPYFWYKFIRPHLAIKSSNVEYTEFNFGKWIYVTGELNDQLFGNDIQQEIALTFGNNYLNNPATVDSLSAYLIKGKNISKSSAVYWAKMIIDNLKTCPNHNGTIWDGFWWYNFCWKWIHVYYRIFLFSRLEGDLDKTWLDNNYYAFFGSSNFQLWSMNNNELKYTGTWQSYKHTAKKYICEVYGSDEYMAKNKRRSLQNLFGMRARNHSITEDFKLVHNSTIPFSEIYCPENDITRRMILPEE